MKKAVKTMSREDKSLLFWFPAAMILTCILGGVLTTILALTNGQPSLVLVVWMVVVFSSAYMISGSWNSLKEWREGNFGRLEDPEKHTEKCEKNK